MKVVLCLLVLLPLALSQNFHFSDEELDKRFIGHLFDSLKKHLPSVETLGRKVIEYLGSDKSEAACEAACPVLLDRIFPGLSRVGKPLIAPTCQWVQRQIQG